MKLSFSSLVWAWPAGNDPVAPQWGFRRGLVARFGRGSYRCRSPSRLVKATLAPDVETHSAVRELAGTPGVVDILRSTPVRGDELATLVEAAFPFSLDAFQKQAGRALVQAKSVMVSAPTGSGKTVVGEIAVFLALSRQMRVFYTTPLKALSNQKFFDFKRQFGEDRVGLLTGDTTVNREAEILVMTTEVYRNMLYASESGEIVGGVHGSRGIIDDVYAVVFDEFHYMNDSSRGTVWEEAVVISPSQVLLVALSATMSNAEELREWFEDVHGPTELILSSFRPVPLRFGFAANDGLYPLFAKRVSAESRLTMHPKLLSRTKAAMRRTKARGGPNLPFFLRKELEPPTFNYLVRVLNRQGLLPGIIFIFSRVGCDRAALEASKQQTPLVSQPESERLRIRLNEFERAHPGAVQEHRIKLARLGVASHHAGLLPLWKSIVEELFQDGLIKVVFATETLAAGINMPARTTVLSSLSKRNGEIFEPLTTSSALQMAGRAGRRGKDPVGNAIVMQSMREGPFDAFNVLTNQVDAIKSQFTPTYGMALNLLQRRTMDDIRQLLEKSFGSFISRRTEQPPLSKAEKENARNYEQFEMARSFLETIENQKSLREFERLRQKLDASRRVLDSCIGSQRAWRQQESQDMIIFAPPGTLVTLQNPPRKKSAEEDARCFDEFGLDLSKHENLSRSPLDYEHGLLVGRLEETKMLSKSSTHLFMVVTKTNRVRVVEAIHIETIDMTHSGVEKFPEEIKAMLAPIESSSACTISLSSPLMPGLDEFRKYKGGQFRAPGNDLTGVLVRRKRI